MHGFLIAIHTIISILLIIVVLMQASQGGGLSGTFGSNMTSSILGGRGAATLLSKITTWFAIAFFGLAIIISIFNTSSTRQVQESLIQKEAENRAVSQEIDLPLPAQPAIIPGVNE